MITTSTEAFACFNANNFNIVIAPEIVPYVFLQGKLGSLIRYTANNLEYLPLLHLRMLLDIQSQRPDGTRFKMYRQYIGGKIPSIEAFFRAQFTAETLKKLDKADVKSDSIKYNFTAKAYCHYVQYIGYNKPELAQAEEERKVEI